MLCKLEVTTCDHGVLTTSSPYSEPKKWGWLLLLGRVYGQVLALRVHCVMPCAHRNAFVAFMNNKNAHEGGGGPQPSRRTAMNFGRVIRRRLWDAGVIRKQQNDSTEHQKPT